MPKKMKASKLRDIPIPPTAGESGDSSDDDAPQEVSGSLSRQDQASRLKDFVEASKKRTEAERERRRQRHEVFRIQKERKLQDLKNRRLPQDVLDAVSKKSRLSDESANDDSKDKSNKSSLIQEEGNHPDEPGDLDMDKGFEDDLCSLDSFIPLERGNGDTIRVRSHHELQREVNKAGNTALEFKTKHYYGRLIPRQTTKQRQSKVAKRRALQQGNKGVR